MVIYVFKVLVEILVRSQELVVAVPARSVRRLKPRISQAVVRMAGNPSLLGTVYTSSYAPLPT
jgi:hypothetical protein